MKPLRIPGLNTYFGGKSGAGVYQQIINRIRPHDTLIVPFAGNCGVTRHMKRPGRVLINDLDPGISTAWAGLELPGLNVFNKDGAEFLSFAFRYLGDLGRTVVYVNPPYLMDSRKGKRDVYRHEMGGAAEHHQLLDTVTTLPAGVDCLVSCYPSELYGAAGRLDPH